MKKKESVIDAFGAFTVALASAVTTAGLVGMVAPPDTPTAQRAVVPSGRPDGSIRVVPASVFASSAGTLAGETKAATAGQIVTAGRGEKPPVIQAAGHSAVAACPCDKCACLNVSICRDGNCDKPYVVSFSMDGCYPCERMKPAYAELRRLGFPVYELHKDIHKGATARVKPRAFPCMIIQRPGGRLERVEGAVTVEYLVERLSK